MTIAAWIAALGSVVSDRLLVRGADRLDRILVPRGELARLHLHDDQLFPLGADDSARLAAGRRQGAGEFLPFKYLAYFPAAIMLRPHTHAELARELLIELAWVVALFAANRIAFARGVRRYGAFGG